MGGGSAPKPDPQMGRAAMMSARTGRDYLAMMKERSGITDQWATEDRARDIEVFRPMQDRFIREAQTFDTPGRQQAAVRQATADVRGEFARADEEETRRLTALGVNPRSGAYIAGARSRSITRGLALAGAQNAARDGVRDRARALRGEAINMGSGLAVNPGTAFGMGTSAQSAGFSGAMRGYGQQADILHTDYQDRLQAQQANNQSTTDLFGAIGMGAGLFLSDEEAKEGKRPARGVLKSLRKMRVDNWRYKPDAPGGDGGEAEHTGTYAQDFQKATGRGDGKTIPVVDAVGVTMGAVKELDAKVTKLARSIKPALAKAA